MYVQHVILCYIVRIDNLSGYNSDVHLAMQLE